MNQIKALTIDFIGGEPMLEFPLIQKIFYYVKNLEWCCPVHFFATTNGTVMSKGMKEWFYKNRSDFSLGLSLDGNKLTHDYNRSNSFDKIDFDFFSKTWPNQTVKMTLSEFSLEHFADNIKFIHSLGFKRIAGVNFAEAYINWDDDKYIKLLISQLSEIEEYYLQHPDLFNQMFAKKLYSCVARHDGQKKYCGTGSNMVFFDTDGSMYPCTFMAPLTLDKQTFDTIKTVDFNNNDLFVDDECYNNCFIYPLCNSCAGANLKVRGSLGKRDKSRCKITQLVTLFIADYTLKKHLQESQKNYSETVNNEKYKADIVACNEIKKRVYPLFKCYFED